jgi:hypothetical protein
MKVVKKKKLKRKRRKKLIKNQIAAKMSNMLTSNKKHMNTAKKF